jgi:DNA-binding HxlR family transcriptional regulator
MSQMETGYQQFCPVAMASDILGPRWTLLIVRNLMLGLTRFNDFRRSLPRMSPTLLSRRLRELEEAGVVARRPSPTDAGVAEYHLTAAGQELGPVLVAIGAWGHRWAESKPQLDKLDAQLLMWDMRRSIRVDRLPLRRTVVQVIYPERPAGERDWWLLMEPGAGTDLCGIDPGYDVDLYVTTDLRTMTAVWMGIEPLASALAAERLVLTGDRGLAARFAEWIGLSVFAGIEKAVA